MPVETFAYIDSLNASNPPGSDGLAQGDDHIRGIKSVLKNTFPSITGATTVTQTTLSALQAGTHEFQIPTGAFMDFAIGTVPTGWLECNGQAVSRVTYARLYAAIGTAYGVGDGSPTGTFNVPNRADRYARTRSGTYALGATPAGQVGTHGHTATGSTTLSIASDGSHSHTGSTTTETTAHTHALLIDSAGDHTHTATVTDPGHVHSGGAATLQDGKAGSLSAGSLGGNIWFNNSGNTSSATTGISVSNSTTGAHTHTGVTQGEGSTHVHLISADGTHAHAGSTAATTVTVANSTTQENMPNTFVVMTCIKT